ncbi:hypothetical protein Ato02nite_024240 [Paractinoplanes toevensis]|uniref:DUF11 domain-containing protein n=1 Tax=Paractinoplanes toevensis TaxID=571911 RepID=A0A919T9K2_9ACTN|nr:hypothetical protein Ato02nite_024240 [Actinoplanes toevensis]
MVFAALLAGLAAPAAAAADTGIPNITVEVPQQVTAVAGRITTVTATVVNHGRTAAADLVLHSADTGALATTCGDEGCPVGDLAAGASRKYTISFTPAAATGVEDIASTFEVSVSGTTGAVLDSAPVTVARTTAGTDLALAGIDDVAVDRGNYTNVPITVRNSGTRMVSHLALVLVAEQALQPVAGYANCEFDRTDDFSYTTVTCLIDQTLGPGQTLSLPATTNPLLVKVAPDAGGPDEYAVSAAVVGVGDTAAGVAAAEPGPRLTLRAAAAPDDLAGDVTSFRIDVSASTAGVSAADPAADDDTTVGSTDRLPSPTGWLAAFIAGALVVLIARRRRTA